MSLLERVTSRLALHLVVSHAFARRPRPTDHLPAGSVETVSALAVQPLRAVEDDRIDEPSDSKNSADDRARSALSALSLSQSPKSTKRSRGDKVGERLPALGMDDLHGRNLVAVR